jgi:hypothetical protein
VMPIWNLSSAKSGDSVTKLVPTKFAVPSHYAPRGRITEQSMDISSSPESNRERSAN